MMGNVSCSRSSLASPHGSWSHQPSEVNQMLSLRLSDLERVCAGNRSSPGSHPPDPTDQIGSLERAGAIEGSVCEAAPSGLGFWVQGLRLYLGFGVEGTEVPHLKENAPF